ncbi:hypothetical protein Ae717Ps2_6604c [Pseudonocardia sp. Ae717_Ps2]|uniref:hypothetical protein n=1 Tax=Pseudonocardia sp. Ae717_Ps2 TaxID=1885573 RepID=UPI00094AABC5|nr:hypothetical protein [Pseudonocardia sp. Ae717_Ps2]OLM28265.1 hypothetical protein Ae717Ps2_6604c [Pseudonocardia sp. Ae717_Ps2]
MSDDNGQDISPEDNGPDPATPGPGRRARANPRDRARDELLAALDARGRRLDETVAEHADLIGQALPRIDTLGERLGELTGRVDELAGAEPAPPPPNPPVHWPELTAERARTEWDRLAGWIAEILQPWYGITRGELPDCWALHPRAVVTLSWLRTAYVAAYLPTARPDAAAEWHTRWYPAALTEVDAAIPAAWCRPGIHRVYAPNERRDWTTRPAEPHESTTGTVKVITDPTSQRYWGQFCDQAIREDLARRSAASR